MKALLIGIANYDECENLKNPANDAMDMASKLSQFGFEVTTLIDCDYKTARMSLVEFEKNISGTDVALFYFAGHGFQVKGANYLAVKDTDAETEASAQFSSVPMDQVLTLMDDAAISTKIIILDACRENLTTRSWSRDFATRGLAVVHAPKGTIICYATSPGEKASDGSGRNGLYTQAILKHIEEQDCSIEEMFKRVRNSVAASSAGRQTTWEHTSLSGNFYFSMSMGMASGEYTPGVFVDKDYRPLAGSITQRIVEALKSYHWYTQNPVIDALQPAMTSQISKNEMFIIGRNIYQSACGSAGSAIKFFEEFTQKTSLWEDEKAKAVLDGALFEVFFDKSGELRQVYKATLLDELLEITESPKYQNSLDFINWCFNAASANQLVEIGHRGGLNLTVNLDDNTVTSIYYSGRNIMSTEVEADPFFGAAGTSHNIDTFVADLSRRFAVHSSKVRLTFLPNAPAGLFIAPRWKLVK